MLPWRIFPYFRVSHLFPLQYIKKKKNATVQSVRLPAAEWVYLLKLLTIKPAPVSVRSTAKQTKRETSH